MTDTINSQTIDFFFESPCISHHVFEYLAGYPQGTVGSPSVVYL